MTGQEFVDGLEQPPAAAPRPELELPELAPMVAPLSSAAACKAFVLGGRAVFTLQGLNARYTYRVTRKDPEPGGKYQQPAYFVALLTGPNNLEDYTYLGMLSAERGAVVLTSKSQYRADSGPVIALGWALGRLWAGRMLPAPAGFFHVGRCARCGRALTVPSSVESGFGPECLAKVGG